MTREPIDVSASDVIRILSARIGDVTRELAIVQARLEMVERQLQARESETASQELPKRL